jgi:hypothetical protein
MSYTKGPLWISGPSQGKERNDDGGDYAIVEPGGIIIGEAFHRVGEDAYRDAEANARLWASAPNLLAALETLLQMVVEGECNYDDQGNEWPEVIQARAALDAAEEDRAWVRDTGIDEALEQARATLDAAEKSAAFDEMMGDEEAA